MNLKIMIVVVFMNKQKNGKKKKEMDGSKLRATTVILDGLKLRSTIVILDGSKLRSTTGILDGQKLHSTAVILDAPKLRSTTVVFDDPKLHSTTVVLDGPKLRLTGGPLNHGQPGRSKFTSVTITITIFNRPGVAGAVL